MESINWVHRCMIVHASIAETCRDLAANLTPAGAGMWTTPLSSTGNPPATAYISSGLVDKSFADLLESPVALSVATGSTLEEAQAIVAGMHISEDEPHTAMQAIGLAFVVEDEV